MYICQYVIMWNRKSKTINVTFVLAPGRSGTRTQIGEPSVARSPTLPIWMQRYNSCGEGHRPPSPASARHQSLSPAKLWIAHSNCESENLHFTECYRGLYVNFNGESRHRQLSCRLWPSSRVERGLGYHTFDFDLNLPSPNWGSLYLGIARCEFHFSWLRALLQWV
jgi:hypothetical protein